MAIKFDKESKTYTVSFHKRHPITRQPVSRSKRGVKTEREARKVLSDLILKVEDHLKRQVIPTWEVFLNQYIEKIDRENELTKGTVYKRDKVLKKHTLPAWSKKRLDQITGQDIRDTLHHSLSGNAESHRKFFVKSIRSIMQHALDLNLIERDPTPKIRFKESDKIKSVLTEDQILTLLEKAKSLEWPWFYHYAVAFYTGLRSGEQYALKWECVELEKRQILVNCSWTSKDGFKSTTKSGHDRVVEIPKPLVPILTELKLKSGSNEFVLPHLPKWTKGEQARELRLFLRSIGLPEIRYHDARASYATLLLSKGVPPSKVMVLGGWRDMKTMMIYMRKAGIDIKGATSCLDDMNIPTGESAKVIDLGRL